MLKSYPVLSNSLFCGAIFASGDLIASTINPKPDRTASAVRAAVYGSCFLGFVAATVTYPILNNLGPRLKPFPRLGARILVDQGLFSPFIYTPGYYGIMSLLEFESPAQAQARIQDNWRSTIETGWSIWVPVQVLNFTLVPQHLRMVTVSIAGLIWNVILATKNNVYERAHPAAIHPAAIEPQPSRVTPKLEQKLMK